MKNPFNFYIFIETWMKYFVSKDFKRLQDNWFNKILLHAIVFNNV